MIKAKSIELEKVLLLKPKIEKPNSRLDALFTEAWSNKWTSSNRYVYTLKVDDEKKAEKIKTSIPKEIEKHEINEKKSK